MVTDRGGDATDSPDVLLIVQGEAGYPNTLQLPAERGAGSNGIGG